MLKEKYPKRAVVLVSKDINLRIKGKALNITVEDYETGKMDDSKLKAQTIPTGRKVIEGVSEEVINEFYIMLNSFFLKFLFFAVLMIF